MADIDHVLVRQRRDVLGERRDEERAIVLPGMVHDRPHIRFGHAGLGDELVEGKGDDESHGLGDRIRSRPGILARPLASGRVFPAPPARIGVPRHRVRYAADCAIILEPRSRRLAICACCQVRLSAC